MDEGVLLLSHSKTHPLDDAWVMAMTVLLGERIHTAMFLTQLVTSLTALHHHDYAQKRT